MFNSEPQPAQRVEELEIRIEELIEAIARSRRLTAGGRAALIAGPALLACLMLGALDFTPARMIGAIALGVGGCVLMGSSGASTNELERLLKLADAERRAAIDALELVDIRDRSGQSSSRLGRSERP